jgi:hypothetical protein
MQLKNECALGLRASELSLDTIVHVHSWDYANLQNSMFS